MNTAARIVIISLGFAACSQPLINDAEVYGNLRQIMQQNQLQARVKSNDLTINENSYALGAMADLEGELMIYEGEVWSSVAQHDSVLLTKPHHFEAALLVKSQVNNWEEVQISKPLSSMKELEQQLAQLIEERQATERIVPFRIEGEIAHMDWHVINAKEATGSGHDAYREAGFSGTTENQTVKILGFYSRNHEGIFTHHGSFLHMHFIKADEAMGHVDALSTKLPVTIYLPKNPIP
ncbi:acetolactate decarboxylase [Roseivirga sp. UBA1976]|mgnify:CR=1 FL=1|uniref:acetolactate decarboxylase n=1 Tax=Roseivirga sp. UBA1976 TaxID=1947386 RepID=UPI00257EADE2|nr:acetolactate decarboxylase [Roseivirga sp. UBA1976]MEC7754945.1 acetolactate decarboxylase [Bacteroidota bacterium]|tara:strand:- start:11767 stop:12477 length:711 start_codon:yes stop_codon:yes gene_type:complete